MALKILRQQTFADARQRFLREVRLIAGLQHPNVVVLYGAGEDAGYAWAAMELLPGSVLEDLDRGRIAPDAVVRVARTPVSASPPRQSGASSIAMSNRPISYATSPARSNSPTLAWRKISASSSTARPRTWSSARRCI